MKRGSWRLAGQALLLAFLLALVATTGWSCSEADVVVDAGPDGSDVALPGADAVTPDEGPPTGDEGSVPDEDTVATDSGPTTADVGLTTPDTDDPDAVQPVATSGCASCHTDKERLMALAVEPPEGEVETGGG